MSRYGQRRTPRLAYEPVGGLVLSSIIVDEEASKAAKMAAGPCTAFRKE
jgi:hypothetical protein